jgi:hypothetical protein
MEAAHWHLLLNHLPIVGTLIAAVLLIAGLAMKNRGVIHSSLVIMVICALFTIPVTLTGEGAEETVEHIEGITHGIIHEHEEAGEKAAWFMYGLGAFALLSLLLSKRKHALAKIVTILTLLLSLTAFYFMFRTGQSGAHIRHSEIRK